MNYNIMNVPIKHVEYKHCLYRSPVVVTDSSSSSPCVGGTCRINEDNVCMDCFQFSYDQMLDTKGNTAIHLLYTHARLDSILSKAKDNFSVNVNDLVSDKTPIVITHSSERNLAFHL